MKIGLWYKLKTPMTDEPDLTTTAQYDGPVKGGHKFVMDGFPPFVLTDAEMAKADPVLDDGPKAVRLVWPA